RGGGGSPSTTTRGSGTAKRREGPAAKTTVTLADDNWADDYSLDYSESLVAGMAGGEGGIDRESRVVTRLLAWVARESRRSSGEPYEMGRHTAPRCSRSTWPGGPTAEPPYRRTSAPNSSHTNGGCSRRPRRYRDASSRPGSLSCTRWYSWTPSASKSSRD